MADTNSQVEHKYTLLRQRLGQLLLNYGVPLGIAVSDDLIVDRLNELLQKNRNRDLTEQQIDRAANILRQRRGSFHF